MTAPPPDRSRDRRIEDATNLWIIHPAARLALPWCLARGVSANTVSLCGLALGALAASAYAHWDRPLLIGLGLLLSIGWLIADGLDGMIARATDTASPLGRALDGMCDHGVFALIYVALAWSIGTWDAWLLGACAGAAHAVQSNLYESERARFHRRLRCLPIIPAQPSRNPLVRLYDRVAGLLDRYAGRFDHKLVCAADPGGLAAIYGNEATAPLRLMSLLSANMRVVAVFLACVLHDPRLFWWFELVPLTILLIVGLAWHRSVEVRLISATGGDNRPRSRPDPSSTRRTF